jgi:hypothetical protein
VTTTFFSPYPVAECLKRVSAITDQWWLAPGTDPVIGKVGEDRFHWRMRTDRRHANLGPRLYVQLRPENGGTRVTGYFRPMLSGAIGILLVFAGFVAGTILGILQLSTTLNTATFDQLKVLMMALCVIGIPVFVWRSWKKQRAGLAGLLQKTLQSPSHRPSEVSPTA